ncbi:hypothetical protein J6590_071672 [Homalodisca vitripennis]|nr:hypothetical protein J6590_071672 [Homalodisca vitripennis]
MSCKVSVDWFYCVTESEGYVCLQLRSQYVENVKCSTDPPDVLQSIGRLVLLPHGKRALGLSTNAVAVCEECYMLYTDPPDVLQSIGRLVLLPHGAMFAYKCGPSMWIMLYAPLTHLMSCKVSVDWFIASRSYVCLQVRSQYVENVICSTDPPDVLQSIGRLVLLPHGAMFAYKCGQYVKMLYAILTHLMSCKVSVVGFIASRSYVCLQVRSQYVDNVICSTDPPDVLQSIGRLVLLPHGKRALCLPTSAVPYVENVICSTDPPDVLQSIGRLVYCLTESERYVCLQVRSQYVENVICSTDPPDVLQSIGRLVYCLTESERYVCLQVRSQYVDNVICCILTHLMSCKVSVDWFYCLTESERYVCLQVRSQYVENVICSTDPPDVLQSIGRLVYCLTELCLPTSAVPVCG